MRERDRDLERKRGTWESVSPTRSPVGTLPFPPRVCQLSTRFQGLALQPGKHTVSLMCTRTAGQSQCDGARGVDGPQATQTCQHAAIRLLTPHFSFVLLPCWSDSALTVQACPCHFPAAHPLVASHLLGDTGPVPSPASVPVHRPP
ncbi:hypothetical protein P7K49_005518 [Saguinus oedipus]|uniref:Uncharacterized protein n=1 Tax=Saguinus oedipus TaxID=9490 RepID=A0ABQ9W2A6_SAGOE|nr:hypothetical protein P7K49_005518 [Saguinus oedipus]